MAYRHWGRRRRHRDDNIVQMPYYKPKRSLRAQWKRQNPLIKFLLIAVVLYFLVGITAVLRYQGPYENMRRIANTSHRHVAFEEKGFLDHLKTMLIQPGLAWKCLWISEDDMYAGLFLAFDVTMDDQTSQRTSRLAETPDEDAVNVSVDEYIYHSYRKESGISPITHEQYHEEFFSSLINFEFDTSFLLQQGLRTGDTYRLTISMQYLNNKNELNESESIIIPVIVGERIRTSIMVEDPDCYITIDAISGFNFE